MPILPFIEDNEENILGIVRKANENGAKFIYPAIGMTLRLNQRDYYYEKLDELFPGVKEKYIHQFGSYYQCYSPDAKRLWNIFANECDKLGILYKMQDIIFGYKLGYQDTQLSFL